MGPRERAPRLGADTVPRGHPHARRSLADRGAGSRLPGAARDHPFSSSRATATDDAGASRDHGLPSRGRRLADCATPRRLADHRGDALIMAGTFLPLVAVVVHEYDPAIRFFVDVLGFDLVEDSPSLTNDGRAKRWVVVRPPGAQTGLLLARADGEHQAAVVGNQHAGRVGFFLRVDDFDARYQRMIAAGV